MRNNDDVMYDVRCRMCGKLIRVHTDEVFPICDSCASTKEKFPRKKDNLRGEEVTKYRGRLDK